MSPKRIQVFFFLIALSISAFGQTPLFEHQPFLPEKELKTIYMAFQDSQGMMWFASSEGAYTFDGFDFQLRSMADSGKVLPITFIFEGKDNKIWFGHQKGEISYFENGSAHFLGFNGKKPSSKITAILEDNNGVLWISTYGEGAFYFHKDEMHQVNMKMGLSENYCYDMVIDEAGDIWIGTDNGISVCKLENEKVKIRQITVNEGLNDFIVESLSKCNMDNIWIGFEDKGVSRFNWKTKKLSIPRGTENWPFGTVRDIISFGDYVWIVTNSSGIIEYDMKKEAFRKLEFPDGHNLKKTKSLFRDSEGNIWLVSDREIFKSSGKNIEVVHTVDEYDIENVRAISSDKKGQTWFANDDGVFRLANTFGQEKRLTNFPISVLDRNQQVICVFPDNFGFVWLGTFGNGLVRLEPSTGNFKLFSEADGLINDNVLSISGKGKQMWFGTLGGASRCILDEDAASLNWKPDFVNFGREQGLGNNYIYQVFADSKGRVWFATDGNGVSMFENGKFRNFSKPQGLDSRIVYSIAEDTDGTIWANTLTKGLYYLEGEKFVKYPEIPEIVSEQIQGIICADSGVLFVLTEHSGGFLDFKKNIFRKIAGQEGIAEFHPDLNDITKGPNGDIWIGTKSGMMKFSTNFRNTARQPKPLVRSVSVVFEPIDMENQITFGYAQNHFMFSYIGLWYQNPEEVTYKVKLEGQDLDWIRTEDQKMAYSNLGPGRYTFRMIAGLDNYFDESNEVSWSFKIKKPFWQTWFFYFAILVLIISGIYFFIKYREKKIRKKQQLLREKIEFQFETLKNQVNPHFLFNSFSTLIALIETNTEDAVEYVEGLSDLFRNILGQKDKQTITIKEELVITKSYFKLQKKRFGDNLHLDIDDKIYRLDFRIPPMVLQMLIENSIKHNVVSKLHPLNIKVYFDEKAKILFVENNVFRKKSEDTSLGIGIKNIVSRFKLLTDRDVIIDASENIFKVGLPVID
ncbi:MAG: hypothetical protein GXO89_08730 [Chlorobi bacterium]|nr:hypothetical protein [Chlorobiota bacterium]